ncbi:MAG: substrate-binding domain-containing protein, partial [Flavobacteriaceae bacterium]|nr:substrate-binding domain-containing protein [Flavobacteriaceae bacterium]
ALGYKIPTDISVLGFADNIVSKLSMPKLSVINQNAEEIGARSVKLLVERLQNSVQKKVFKTEIIPTSIVENGSN